jgi:rhodanese-related sulfurtransferase
MTREVEKPDTGRRAGWAIAAAAVFLLFALSACAKPKEPSPPWKVIDAETLHGMMKSGQAVTVIDVMSEIDCRDHRIPGSQCIACEEIEKDAKGLPADRDRMLVFYCESEQCYTSCRAADAAVKYGYRNVYTLAGGIPAWKQAGYPVESIERIPRGLIRSVKADTLRKWIAERKDLFILDIRSEKYYQAGHIEGAVNIPEYQLQNRYTEIPLNRLIVLVDNRGFRTFLAASYLEQKGFSTMRLFGGMKHWQDMLAKKP